MPGSTIIAWGGLDVWVVDPPTGTGYEPQPVGQLIGKGLQGLESSERRCLIGEHPLFGVQSGIRIAAHPGTEYIPIDPEGGFGSIPVQR